MKHQLIPFGKALPFVAVVSFFLSLAACQNDIDGPSLSCPEMKMTVNIGDRSSAMSLSSSIIFRTQTDSGGQKFLNMETVSDTFKVILNLTDGGYNDIALKDDSLRLDTFFFSRTGVEKNGLVAAAIMNNSGNYDFQTTDTSWIIIRKMNTRTQTISGSFFFMTDNQNISGAGSFENACYVSLQ